MLPSCGSLVLLVCLPCWVSAVFGGSATCTGRSMAESPRTSSMVNLFMLPTSRPTQTAIQGRPKTWSRCFWDTKYYFGVNCQQPFPLAFCCLQRLLYFNPTVHRWLWESPSPSSLTTGRTMMMMNYQNSTHTHSTLALQWLVFTRWKSPTLCDKFQTVLNSLRVCLKHWEIYVYTSKYGLSVPSIKQWRDYTSI